MNALPNLLNFTLAKHIRSLMEALRGAKRQGATEHTITTPPVHANPASDGDIPTSASRSESESTPDLSSASSAEENLEAQIRSLKAALEKSERENRSLKAMAVQNESIVKRFQKQAEEEREIANESTNKAAIQDQHFREYAFNMEARTTRAENHAALLQYALEDAAAE